MAGRVACGTYHSMCVTEKLELYVWGGNFYGQVGWGTTPDATTPQAILRGTKVKWVAAGQASSLAVTAAGEVYAWGNNDECLLGTGSKLKQDVPTKVINGGIKAVSAGWKHCLALTEAGEVFAWGGNDYGQLGDGTRTNRVRPVRVIAGNVKAIACGWYHNLAITEAGDVLTWGFTSQDPHSGIQRSLIPSLIINGGIKAIAAGATHNLALTEEGTILAWGGNGQGQLGDGTMSRRITPITIATNCIGIAAGSYHSVALDENYNVLQWGFTISQTHHHAHWNSETDLSKVHLDGGAFAVFAGGVHNIVIDHQGELHSWGGNSCGQIGNGKVSDKIWPFCVMPSGTMETIPLDEVIAAIMKGPAEMAKQEAKAVKDSDAHKYQPAVRRPSLSALERGVPELMRKSIGDRPRPGPGPGATYPLSYNGSRGMPKSSCSTGSLGFVPGTGFRPGTLGNTMEAMRWPDGPGTMNPYRRKRNFVSSQSFALTDNFRRTDPAGLAALGDSASLSGGQLHSVAALGIMAATDGFGSGRGQQSGKSGRRQQSLDDLQQHSLEF